MSAKKTPAATLEFDDNKLLRALGGPHAKHFSRIEQKLNVAIDMRGNLVSIQGPGSTKDRERAGASDLPGNKALGLNEALAILEGVGITRFCEQDVVRHPLVARIVAAYSRHGKS